MSGLKAVDYHLLQSDRTRFANDFFEQLATFGFAVVVNAPINPTLVERLYIAARRVFHLPLYVRQKYKDAESGWTGVGVERAVGATVSDLKQFWHFRRDLHMLSHGLPRDYRCYYPRNIFPKEVPEFKQLLGDMFVVEEKLAFELLTCLDKPLGFKDGYLTGIAQNGMSTLRVLHYPALDTLIGVPENAVRAEAHTDINLLTLLVESRTGGLQILRRGGARENAEDWISLNADPGAVIVNVGDMLSWMTPLLPSTLHRVVNPEDPTSERFSLPFFCHPAANVILPGAEGRPNVEACMYLQKRLAEIGLTS